MQVVHFLRNNAMGPMWVSRHLGVQVVRIYLGSSRSRGGFFEESGSEAEHAMLIATKQEIREGSVLSTSDQGSLISPAPWSAHQQLWQHLPVLCGQHHQPGEQGACVHCSRGYPVWPDHVALIFYHSFRHCLSLSPSSFFSTCCQPVFLFSFLILSLS